MNLKNALFVLLAVVIGGLLFLRGCDGPTPGPGPDPKPTPAPVVTGQLIKTYTDGKLTQTIEAKEVSAQPDSTAIDYKLEKADATGATTGHYDGTYVVEYRGWQSSENSTHRYKVTLYSGTTAVGEWKVTNFSTDQRSVLLFTGKGGNVLRVNGSVVIETISGTTGGAPVERLTLKEGDKVLYSKDLAWSLRIKHYVQGQPANGAGLVFIWGDVTVEPIK